MELSEAVRPGLILSQVWPGTRSSDGETLRALEHVLREGFFKAVHTLDVPTAHERRRIADVCAAADVHLTYCLTKLLTENSLTLADTVESGRRLAVDAVHRWLEQAREQGAAKILLVSGTAPVDERERVWGLAQFERSLIEICRNASAAPRVQVLVEALDVRAHKKCTFGFSHEATDIVRRVSRLSGNLTLCLDTAHLLLNGEDPAAALRAAADVVSDFHFCNCVTDPASPLYGDWHLPFGPPGPVDVSTVGALMAQGIRAGVFDPARRPSVYCEIFTRPQDNSFENMKTCRRNLEEAWQTAQPLHQVAL